MWVLKAREALVCIILTCFQRFSITLFEYLPDDTSHLAITLYKLLVNNSN